MSSRSLQNLICLAGILAFTIQSECLGQQDYPIKLPDPGPSLHTPVDDPNDPNADPTTQFGSNTFSLWASADKRNVLYPNPLNSEPLYQGASKIGTFEYGAKYNSGPQGSLDITDPYGDCTYELLLTGTTLKYYGVFSTPEWTDANWETNVAQNASEVNLHEHRTYAGDFECRAYSETDYGGWFANIPLGSGTQSLYTSGRFQFWER